MLILILTFTSEKKISQSLPLFKKKNNNVFSIWYNVVKRQASESTLSNVCFVCLTFLEFLTKTWGVIQKYVLMESRSFTKFKYGVSCFQQ
jgi:hypothetical protein